MLTRKQHELLTYVNQRLKADGVSPSFDEMKDALGLRSKSGVHRLITALEERGFIGRLPHRARALQVLKLPNEMAAPERLPANVVRGRFTGPRSAKGVGHEGGSVNLPLYGRIAAGAPIEALRDHTNTIDVPAGMLGRGEHFALEVDGDSMIDAGILDGDTAIIRRGETAETGAIVVALIDELEVTLKRIRRKGESIALESANTKYETRIFPPDRVKVQGRLVALMRKY